VPLVSLQKKQKPGNYGPVAGQVVTHEQYGAVLQKGSKLLPVVDTTMKALIANGTVGKLQKKWFNIDFSTVPVLK
jgi:ABC-type amino acid transport substrate-binding protein